MLSIGEFAHSTMLSIKTIRYYQELGILIPAKVDEVTGYRYFDQNNYERARSIQMLKELGFTLKEIRQILSECREEEDLFLFIDEKLNDVDKRIRNLKKMKEQLIKQKQNSFSGDQWEKGIIEFNFNLPCYVSRTIQGRYEQIGESFAYLYKHYGRFAIGKAYAFYDELGYSEDAGRLKGVIEIEAGCSDKSVPKETFLETRAVKIIHEGPYGTQGSSYVQLFSYCRNRDFKIRLPVIEHFIKGPGMIFKGDPQKYRTECILLIED